MIPNVRHAQAQVPIIVQAVKHMEIIYIILQQHTLVAHTVQWDIIQVCINVYHVILNV